MGAGADMISLLAGELWAIGDDLAIFGLTRSTAAARQV
jgi:hypothetical protein